MEIKAFYDDATYTLTYVVWDAATKDAVVIDPVLNYDPLGSQTSTEAVDEVADFVHEQKLKLRAVLETHAHADHLSGSQVLKHRFDVPVVIGERITAVQETFKGIFQLGDGFPTDGSQFDKLIKHGEIWQAGSLSIEAMATPGHTPACMTYKIEDAIFTGDALFMHDYGTGRTDFPRGSARDLYRSVHDRLYALPDDTRVFVGHDYQPDQRELRYETTIGKSKRCNPQLRAETTEEEFVEFRTTRDSALAAPRLLFQSVQVNVNAGHLPESQPNGVRYLKLPLNLFRPADERGEPLPHPKAAE
jgi:glyoxylase-like metal-dependent hydrolase (beta-lactamase superfamily II)